MALEDNINDAVSEKSWDMATASNPTEVIQSSIVEQLQSKQPSGQVSVEDLISYYPDGVTPDQQKALDQQNYFDENPVTGRLPNEAYYPNMNDPIAKGNYSGSVIGSTTLFAPGGGLVPYGIIDAREQAMRGAAEKRAKQISDFESGLANAVPQTTHKVVQPQLQKVFWEGMNKVTPYLQKKYGKNWATAGKNDPVLKQYLSGMNSLATQENSIADKYALIQNQIKSGDFVATPELQEKMQNYLTDVQGLSEGPFNPNGQKLSNTILEFNAEYESNKLLNVALAKFGDKITETVKTQYGGDYDKFISDKRTNENIDAELRALTDDIADRFYGGGTKYNSKETLFRKAKALAAKKQELQLQTAAKHKQSGDEAYDYNSAPPQTEFAINAINQDGGEDEIYFEKGYNTNTGDGGKEIRIAITPDMSDTQGKKLGKEAAFLSGKVQTVGNMPYNKKDGRFYTSEEVKSMKEKGTYNNNPYVDLRPAAILNITPSEKDKENGIKGQNSAIVPIENIEGKFTNSKKRGGQQDLEDKIKELKAESETFNSNKKKISSENKTTTKRVFSHVDPKTGKPVYK